MQAKKRRFRPASLLTAEGKPDGIVTKIQLISNFTKAQITETETEEGKIKAIADSYRNILKWIESQDDGTREKFKSTKNRVRFQAESQIIRDGAIFPNYYELFGITKKTLIRKIVLRKKLIEFAVKVLTEPFFLPYIKAEALKGRHTDFSKFQELKREYEELLYRNLITEAEPSQEAIEELLNQEHTIEEPPDNPLTDQERHRKLLELLDQIGEEINIRNKEKRKPENLCFFLLYDVEKTLSQRYSERVKSSGIWTEPTTDEYDITFTENIEGMKERILNLSRSNLIQLIRIYCNAHNDFYKDDISDERQINKANMNNERKKKKTVTADEKRELIQMGKSDGMKQTEVAKQIPCSLRLVKDYWN